MKNKKNSADDFYSFYETEGGNRNPRASFQRTKKMPLALRILAALFVGVLAVSAWFGYLYFSKRLSKSADPIIVSVKAPAQAENGSTVEYVFAYEHIGRAPVPDVALFAEYPTGFTILESEPQAENIRKNYWNIGTLQPRQKGIVRIRGALSGFENEEKKATFSLQYAHPAYRSSFVLKKEHSIRVMQAKADRLSMDGPVSINAGGEVQFVIRYQDVSKMGNPEQVMLSLALPDGVTIEKSEPAVSNAEKKEWNGFALSKSIRPDIEGGVLNVTLAVAETVQGEQRVAARLFLRDSNGMETEVLSAERTLDVLRGDLILSLVNTNSNALNAIQLGSRASLSIAFENKGNITFRNVSIRLAAISSAFELDESSFETGERTDATIAWSFEKNALLKEIKSGQKGTLPLTLALKEREKIDVPSLKAVLQNGAEFALDALIEEREEGAGNIMSEPLEIQGPRGSIPILSDALLRAFARDITNSASSDKKTIRVYYAVTNTIHDITDIEISGALPAGVEWIGVNTRTAGDIVYNAEQKKVVWKLNALPAAVPRIDGSFDVSIPSTVVLSKTHIMEGIQFRANDRIANNAIMQNIDALTVIDTDEPL